MKYSDKCCIIHGVEDDLSSEELSLIIAKSLETHLPKKIHRGTAIKAVISFTIVEYDNTSNNS